MLSDLRSLRERIRQVEAGGHRDTPLRRAYNHKLRALKGLKGGGGGVFGPPEEIFGPPEEIKYGILKNKRGLKTSDNRYFVMNQNGELHRYSTNKSGQKLDYKGMDIVWSVPDEDEQAYNKVSVGTSGIIWDNELKFYSCTGPVYMTSVINEKQAEQAVEGTDEYKNVMEQLKDDIPHKGLTRRQIIKQAPTIVKHRQNLKAWYTILKKYSMSNQLSHFQAVGKRTEEPAHYNENKQKWKGMLTFKRGHKNEVEVTRHFKLYDNCVLERYDDKEERVEESMVVVYAPYEDVSASAETITFIDGNGKRHEFTNPIPGTIRTKDIRDKFWDNSVSGKIDKRPDDSKLHSTIYEIIGEHVDKKLDEHDRKINEIEVKLDERIKKG